MGARLEGADAFKRMLMELGKDCKQVQTEIVNEQAKACLAAASKETPVHDYTRDLFVDTQNKRITYASFKTGDAGRATFRVRNVKQGGTLQRGWRIKSGTFSTGRARAEVFNNVSYAGYVNDGHRIVNRKGATVDWKPGKFMLEAGIKAAEKVRDRRYRTLLEEVRKRRGL